MALEAVVYQKGLFGHYDGNKDLYNSMQQNWSWDFNLPKGDQDQDQDQSQEVELQEINDINGYLGYVETQQRDQDQDPWELQPLLMAEWTTTPDSSEGNVPSNNASIPPPPPPPAESTLDQCAVATSSTKPKRRRFRSKKNKEEIESQRMTHIAVERNRRKQMNEYLSILKSLMPDSYVQRIDQASIVGGAINYVKELEQNLHCLSAQKTPLPFKDLFSFPQYSMMTDSDVNSVEMKDGRGYGETSSVADVEVTMVESHANLKIGSRKHPKQLLKLVSGLQSLRLSILHLNVSTLDHFALYSISVKVEDDSRLKSVDEVAAAVHQLLGRIQEEASLN